MNTIYFDLVIRTYVDFPGYVGNPPQSQEEYSNLQWFSDWNKPTWQQVEVKIAELEVLKYKEDRAKEYPKIADQLDMLYHDIKNGTLDSGAWIQAIEAVKTQYPKP